MKSMVVRHSRLYRKQRRLLRISKGWTSEQMRTYQIDKLRELLIHAEKNVPYYSDLFRQVRFSPEQFSSLDEMQKIPLLTKSVFRDKLKELVADNIPVGDLSMSFTGGSTGEPVRFYQLKHRVGKLEKAFVDEIWSSTGVSEHDSIAVLRGGRIPQNARDGFYWKYRPFHRQLLLSTQHLTRESADRYAELLIKYRIRHIHTFPSAIGLFARILENSDFLFPDLKTVLTSSEVVQEWTRELTQEVLGVSIFDLYGNSEKVVIAAQCDKAGSLKVYPQYGYTELISPDGTPVTEPGLLGEIVGTSFLRYATPLIRYRTGDEAILKEPMTPGCYPIFSKIYGRTQDYVISRSGREISVSLLNIHSDALRNVLRFQFFQEIPGELVLRIVPAEGFTARDIEVIKEELRANIGLDFNLSVKLQDHVDVSRTNKAPILIQRLSISRSN
jgi:phenylacetate-CoA ligase